MEEFTSEDGVKERLTVTESVQDPRDKENIQDPGLSVLN
jgi:hypothetical protein